MNSNNNTSTQDTNAPVKVFAYGSLNEAIFGKRKAFLNGFKIFMRGWPSVQQAPGRLVVGNVVDLTPAEFDYLKTEAVEYGNYHFFDAEVWSPNGFETVKVIQMVVDATKTTKATSDRL